MFDRWSDKSMRRRNRLQAESQQTEISIWIKTSKDQSEIQTILEQFQLIANQLDLRLIRSEAVVDRSGEDVPPRRESRIIFRT